MKGKNNMSISLEAENAFDKFNLQPWLKLLDKLTAEKGTSHNKGNICETQS